MDAIEALTTRASNPRLSDPGPTSEDVQTIVRAALRAPDHGLLRPWRFITIAGEARERFGDVLADALTARTPDVPQAAVENERAKPLRAPLILVVVANVDPHHLKIPEIEQVTSAAAAAQNVCLSAHALGYGCFWRTGLPAYDASVKKALGVAAKDHIVGFMYVGTPTAAAPDKGRRPEVGDFLEAWQR